MFTVYIKIDIVFLRQQQTVYRIIVKEHYCLLAT